MRSPGGVTIPVWLSPEKADPPSACAGAANGNVTTWAATGRGGLAPRGPPGTATRRSVPRPRDQLARVQPARARARRGPRRPAARADPVPGDRREQPRRVLHGPRRRAQAAHRRRRRRRAPPSGMHAARGARAHLVDQPTSSWSGTPPCFHERGRAGAGRGGHRDPPLGGARPTTSARRPARSSPTGSSRC